MIKLCLIISKIIGYGGQMTVNDQNEIKELMKLKKILLSSRQLI